MKKIGIILITIIIFKLSGTSVFAQQDAQYSQYMFNMLSVNPGYAGSKQYLNALFLSRNQWVGIEGAPKTQSVTLHAPIVKKNIGLGFSFVNDQIGPINENSFFIDFAYTLQVKEDAWLAMGLKSGFNMHSVDVKSLETTEMADPAFYKNIDSRLLPNFGFGLYYYTKNYYLGVSTPRLLKNKIGDDGVETAKLGNQERHFFFIAGYVMDINDYLKFKPTVLTKATPGAPLSVDVSANFMFYEKLWAGLFCRIGDAIGGTVQYNITDQLVVGYAYDHTTSQLGGYNSGTHEIMISYDFWFRKARVKSPRYF